MTLLKKIKCFDISKEFKLINNFTATSELAFSLILALNRKLIPSILEVKNGHWSREKFQGFQLLGKTLGIIGLGRLGKISANIGAGFGMKVIANDIKKIKYNNVKMVSLKKLATILILFLFMFILTIQQKTLLIKVFFLI